MNKIKFELIPLGEHSLKKIIIDGPTSGPHLHIQSSVHGAEILGNGVINELVKFLKDNPIKGKITIIPEANPYSKNNKSGTYTTGRFCPITGDNWNRLYTDITKCTRLQEKAQNLVNRELSKVQFIKDYKKIISESIKLHKENPYNMHRGKRLCLELQNNFSEADIFLDLHTGPVATDYLYSSKRQQQMALSYPIENQIIIPNLFDGAGDEAFFAPWTYIERLTNTSFYHGEVYTIELGSEENFCAEQIKIQSDKLIQFLENREICERTSNSKTTISFNQKPLCNFKTYFCPQTGHVNYLKKPGEKIKKGEEIYNLTWFDPSRAEALETTIVALEDATVINHCPSGNVLNGMEVYQVLED